MDILDNLKKRKRGLVPARTKANSNNAKDQSSTDNTDWNHLLPSSLSSNKGPFCKAIIF